MSMSSINNSNNNSTRRFTVSFTTATSRRMFETHLLNRDAPREDAIAWGKHPRVARSSRTDINMGIQVVQQAQRCDAAHAAWVEKHKAQSSRTAEDEKHHLKVLVKTAVLRQRVHGSCNLSKIIYSRMPKSSSTKAAPAKGVTQSQAFDLSFVGRKLVEDIDIVYASHGYKVTLTTFGQLNPWVL